MKKAIYILVFLISAASFSQNNALFQQGKDLYKSEKYSEAIGVWNKIIETKEHSAALYFNLANAHYKINQIGPSIYYYEKALLLSPNDSEIKNNLAFAQNATIDAIEPLPKNILSTWYQNISGIFTYNGWAVIAIVFSLSCIVLFLLYYFSFSEGKKRIFFVGSLLSILVLFISLGMAYTTYNDSSNNHPAIVFSESIDVKSEPNLGSEIAFTLHEGTKVQILSKEDDWAKIILADGKDGWIPLSDLKEL